MSAAPSATSKVWEPGSANVPILISVGLTPWAGEPDGLPFLHTTSLVPNAPDDALAVLAPFEVVEVSEPLSLSSRPQAA